MKKYNSLSDIEWTPKNIAMVTAASLVMLCGIWYGNYRSVQMHKEKERKLQALSLEELGTYIVRHNSGIVKIDWVTSVKNVHLEHNNTLEFPYHVSDNFLSRIETKDLTKKRKNLQYDTLQEDCSKLAFKLFLKKGGEIHYTYYLVKRGTKKYLFDFNNTYDMCPQNDSRLW